MLTSTFVLLNGIGLHTERRLWHAGVLNWDNFLDSSSLSGISSARKTWYDSELAAAQSHLHAGDAQYFATCLKPREHWRLFDAFHYRVLYLLIETTVKSARDGEGTIVGLVRNGCMRSL